MPKPIPASEITIKPLFDDCLIIDTTTLDAASWVRQNAPEFGWFHDSGTSFLLAVRPSFNRDEVGAYILALGEETEEEEMP